jgi:hypothetical protein
MTTIKPKRLFLSPPLMGGRESDFVREGFASNYIVAPGPMVDSSGLALAE